MTFWQWPASDGIVFFSLKRIELIRKMTYLHMVIFPDIRGRLPPFVNKPGAGVSPCYKDFVRPHIRKGSRTGVSPLNIHIYIYIHIYAQDWSCVIHIRICQAQHT